MLNRFEEINHFIRDIITVVLTKLIVLKMLRNMFFSIT